MIGRIFLLTLIVIIPLTGEYRIIIFSPLSDIMFHFSNSFPKVLLNEIRRPKADSVKTLISVKQQRHKRYPAISRFGYSD